MQDFADSPRFDFYPDEPPRRSTTIWWILGGAAAIVFLACGGMLTALAVVGIRGPDTAVYTGNRIPARFIQTMESVGALEAGEKIVYFYSDAMLDIREGFYFVSDRKVAIYQRDRGDSPLTVIPFDEIAAAELSRDTSFLNDSEILLILSDQSVISFPVSSEHDRDQQFFDAIDERVGAKAEEENEEEVKVGGD